MIEIDDDTADRIVRRAAEMGVTSAEVVAILVKRDEEADVENLAELERHWSEAGQTIPHDDVLRWLETWGTADFKPWSLRR